MKLLYQPRNDEQHLAPFQYSHNLDSHSEDAGGLVRDILDRQKPYESATFKPYLCDRPPFGERRDNPLAE